MMARIKRISGLISVGRRSTEVGAGARTGLDIHNRQLKA